MQVLVSVFGEVDLGARPRGAWRWRFARRGGEEQCAIIAVIIEDTGRFRGAAGDLGQQAGKGIRRLSGRCVGVGEAMVRQLFKVRTRAFRDTNRKVHGMEAVNAHEQHMSYFFVVVGERGRRL